jgi:hypothetical protein
MIEALRRLVCSYLCKSEETPHPFTTLRHRSGQHIRLVLQKQYPNARIRIADADYSAPTLREFEAWLRADPVSEMVYRKEFFDCDDSARAVRCAVFKVGRALKTTITLAYVEGYAPEGYHAYNLLIDGEDTVWIVEPQSDHCVEASRSSYMADFIQL